MAATTNRRDPTDELHPAEMAVYQLYEPRDGTAMVHIWDRSKSNTTTARIDAPAHELINLEDVR